MAKKSKSKNTVTANFKDVKTIKTPAEGTYLVKVTDAELTTSSNDNEMIKFEFEVVSGKFAGSKLWYNTMTAKESLWKLREVLEALGQDVPDGKMDIDLDDLIDCECGVVVFHEVYEGKNRAKIADFLAADEVDTDEETDDEEEDEKPTKKGKKSSKKEVEEDDDEAEEDVDVDSMDEDELAEFVSEKDLDIDLDDFKTLKKKRAAVKEALESSDDESEDDEDESEDDGEETMYSEDQINDMEIEELVALNEDLELDIDDLEDLKPKKARAAVLKALKKKGLLEN